ncbi:MAG: hypothetical protein J7J52_01230, partial [Deltaproteobacteria bacterium]|nr:hypothetical protein [Deltaproteobacteria bacterium]
NTTLESEEELDGLITEYNDGDNIYVKMHGELYTPKAFRDNFYLYSNNEFDKLPLWLYEPNEERRMPLKEAKA